jgi:hypothetical protein
MATQKQIESMIEKIKNDSKQQTAMQMMLEYLQQRGFEMEYEMELSFLEHEKEMLDKCYGWAALSIVDMGHGDTFEEYFEKTFKK